MTDRDDPNPPDDAVHGATGGAGKPRSGPKLKAQDLLRDPPRAGATRSDTATGAPRPRPALPPEPEPPAQTSHTEEPATASRRAGFIVGGLILALLAVIVLLLFTRSDNGSTPAATTTPPVSTATAPPTAAPRPFSLALTALHGAAGAHGTTGLAVAGRRLRITTDLFVPDDRFIVKVFGGRSGDGVILDKSVAGRLRQVAFLPARVLASYRWIGVLRERRHAPRRHGQSRPIVVLRVSTSRLLAGMVKRHP